jgi:translation initiation factor eIF-2B subunit delta
VTGSSERCLALLSALRALLTDLVPSLAPGPELYRDIDNLIKPNITFLKQCRPLSISMQNAIRFYI